MLYDISIEEPRLFTTEFSRKSTLLRVALPSFIRKGFPPLSGWDAMLLDNSRSPFPWTWIVAFPSKVMSSKVNSDHSDTWKWEELRDAEATIGSTPKLSARCGDTINSISSSNLRFFIFCALLGHYEQSATCYTQAAEMMERVNPATAWGGQCNDEKQMVSVAFSPFLVSSHFLFSFSKFPPQFHCESNRWEEFDKWSFEMKDR